MGEEQCDCGQCEMDLKTDLLKERVENICKEIEEKYPNLKGLLILVDEKGTSSTSIGEVSAADSFHIFNVVKRAEMRLALKGTMFSAMI